MLSAHQMTPLPAALPAPAPSATPAGPRGDGRPSFSQILVDQAPASPPAPPAQTEPVPARPDGQPEAHRDTDARLARRAQQARANGSAPATPPAKAPAPATGDATAAAAPVDTAATDTGPDAAKSDTSADAHPETAGLAEFTALIGLAPAVTTAAPESAAAPAEGPTALAPTAAAATPDAPATAQAATNATQPVASQMPSGPALAEAGRQTARAIAPVDTPETRDGHAEPATDSPKQRATDGLADARSTPVRRGAEALKAAAADTPRARAADAAEAQPGRFAEALRDARMPLPAMPAMPAPGPDLLNAALAGSLPSAAASGIAGADAPVATARLQAALHSSAFAPELATRVSLLAAGGGVQSAELQLNPAEMGPVMVQIVVDGAQAQVSFHAAQAETRQALEQSLPDLAAALQGSGLTLSGGGVFQQAPREQAQAQAADGATASRGRSAGSEAAEGSTATASAPAARRTVGLLDTFA